MTELSSTQKKYLRGLAHDQKALVIIGKQGVTKGLIDEIDNALDIHELVKVKFIEHKEEKKELAEQIEEKTSSAIVGRLGNTAVFYRQQRAPNKRKIKL